MFRQVFFSSKQKLHCNRVDNRKKQVIDDGHLNFKNTSLYTDFKKLGNEFKCDNINSDISCTMSDNLTILHQNIQHLPSRIDLLNIVLEEINPDIVAISEHKMKATELECLSFQNFYVCSYFCRQSTTGGGVLILAKNQIEAKSLNLPSISSFYEEKVFECCLSKINFKTNRKSESIVVACLYRSPNANNLENFFDKLNCTLDVLSKINDRVILCGDFNINVLIHSKSHLMFNNILNMHGMYYLVTFPTRITEICESGIDNFVTNLDKDQLQVKGVVTEISDHDAQLLTVPKYKIPKTANYITETCRQFKPEQVSLFINYLSKESWEDVYFATVENKFDTFYSVFKYYFDICFPKLKKKKFKNAKTWLTEEIKYEKRNVTELSKQLRRCKSNNYLKVQLKERKKLLKMNIEKAKQQYFDKKLSSSKNVAKTAWNIINDERGKVKGKCDNIYLINENKKIVNPLTLSNMFNDYFSTVIDTNVIPKLENSTSFRGLKSCVNHSFLLKEVTEAQVSQAIDSLNNKLSSGFDEIPSIVIKKSKFYLVKPLTHLINSSFISGIFPQKLKIGKIKPVFKKGNRNDVTSYRPVSLLPNFSKIYERLVYNQFADYLETNILIDKEQHGFRSGKSVTTAAIDFVEKIIDNIDKKKKIAGMFLDLTKAFDSVSHPTLIEILKQLGVHKKSLGWFCSYINDRLQYVEVTHTVDCQIQKFSSSYRAIRYGVPQGSILGPLLFVCYLSGLGKVMSGDDTLVCLYADDTNILTTADTYDLLEASSFVNLSVISQFFDEHNLLVNVEKTKLMQFSHKRNNCERQIGLFYKDKEIGCEEQTKFLGLHIDRNLDWTGHIDHVARKVSTGLYVLRRMVYTCSLETLKTIYFSLIQSHVQFGLVVYGSTTANNLNRILKLQKQALRIILGLKWKESVKGAFSRLEIPTVHSLYIFETVMLVINSNLVGQNHNNHAYNTRNNHISFYERHHLEFFKKKPSYIGIKFFKHLPNFIKKDYLCSKFKTNLKKFLTSKAFYSFEEFFSECAKL